MQTRIVDCITMNMIIYEMILLEIFHLVNNIELIIDYKSYIVNISEIFPFTFE